MYFHQKLGKQITIETITYRSELGQTALERPKRDTSKKQKKILV